MNAMYSAVLSPEEESLIRAGLALTTGLDERETCEAMLNAVEATFAANATWILLHDEAADELVTCVARGAGSTAYLDLRIPAHSGIAGLAFSMREPVFVPDVAAETRWYDPDRIARSSLRSVLTAPLIHEGRAIGVVGLDATRFRSGAPPSSADIARLQGLAALAAVGIRHARLFGEIEADRTRLRRLLSERRLLRSEVHQLKDEIRGSSPFGTVIGEAGVLQDVLRQVTLVAPADTSVFLSGETGTGKELIARVIHANSRRAGHAFVPVNCAALPESLVESELFGYERGAFTGAFSRKPGKFELADRGTLFLDEIGDLPLAAQAKLLRVVQEREVQRVGGTHSIAVNVRLIAATNQDLTKRIAEGQFRSDLYYRLTVFPIELPPLRERREDIPALARHFIARCAERLRKPAPTVAPDAMQRLIEYDWPGNVRELQNVIERALILAGTATIERLHLLFPAVPAQTQEVDRRSPAERSTTLFDAERRIILRTVESCGWRISGRSGAAAMLGLRPTTLHAKMKRLGIVRPSARTSAGEGASVGG